MQINKYNQFTILIPCYNEQKTIGSVITQMLELNPCEIVVVDDCSKDNSREIVQSFTNKGHQVTLIKNKANGGAGYALRKGFEYIQTTNASYVVTVDADEQHTKNDTKRIMDAMLERKDLIISGTRVFKKEIPFSKKLSNFGARFAFVVLYGINYKDPFCGLRCYSKEILHELKFAPDFQWLVSVNKIIKKYHQYSSTLDIEAVYTDYSLKKGLNLRKGVKVFLKMFVTRLKELTNRTTPYYLHNKYSYKIVV